MEKGDVYIVTQSGSLTICDWSIAENAIRQLRSGGRTVKVFRDRKSFLEYEADREKEYNEQKRIMSEDMRYINDNHRTNKECRAGAV